MSVMCRLTTLTQGGTKLLIIFGTAVHGFATKNDKCKKNTRVYTSTVEDSY